ncbi:hypothetical protein TSUD_401020 [Trifolium subterraneum]|uniref:RNase H type-1 domain-containing protein n=1 Tax=Trifolium subterraneum TaxID=3900 RepID=A0A2Z6P8G8_TRISU|nr:hypothetical protein TSUD_401020 [Trifolium subterraneum]
MVAWAVELSEYDITFVPRGNIKSQLLADFILELSSPPEATNMQPWTLSVDEASNIRGSGAGVVLEGPDGVLIEQSLRFAFKARNNQAEYEALIAGMRLAKEMEVADLRAKSDSQLVTSQVSGEFQAKDPQLIKYLEQVRSLAKHFNTFELIYVPREQNARTDLLSKLASTKKPGNNRTVIQETVAKPSTGDLEVWMVTRNDDWRTPIIQYLENEKLPEEKEEKVKIKKRAAHYTMVGGELYKRGFSSPMLLCVGETESRRILNEIHNGSCGSHIGGRSLAGKVTRAGFFWPTLLSDANRHAYNPRDDQNPNGRSSPEGDQAQRAINKPRGRVALKGTDKPSRASSPGGRSRLYGDQASWASSPRAIKPHGRVAQGRSSLMGE